MNDFSGAEEDRTLGLRSAITGGILDFPEENVGFRVRKRFRLGPESTTKPESLPDLALPETLRSELARGDLSALVDLAELVAAGECPLQNAVVLAERAWREARR